MNIQRSYELTEHDDFERNVKDYLNSVNEAVPIYNEGNIIMWNIKSRYE